MAQLHNLVGQEPQRPLAPSHRRRTARQRNQVGFLLPVELALVYAPARPWVQRGIKSFFHELAPDPLDRRAPHIERRHDLLVRPAWTARPLIGLEEDPRTGQAPRSRPPCGNALVELLAFNLGQGDAIVLLRHAASVGCSRVTAALHPIPAMTQ